MNKRKNTINIKIIATILIGNIVLVASLMYIFNNLSKHDVEVISETTANTIYEQVNSLLKKPVLVAEVVARDSYLKTFLNNENKKPSNETVKKIKSA